MKKILFYTTFVFLFLFAAAPAQAFVFKSGDNFTLPAKDQTKSTLVVTGHSLDIAGQVNGDLICAGQKVNVSGKINGDVLCAADELTISGTITGSVRSVGNTIVVAGKATKLMLAGQVVTASSSAQISGESIIAGQTVTLDAPLGSHLLLAAQDLAVNNKINGDLTAFVKNITFGTKALLSGNFDYWRDDAFTLPDKTVSGVVTRHDLPQAVRDWQNGRLPSSLNLDKAFQILKLVNLATFFVFGLIILWLFPSIFQPLSLELFKSNFSRNLTLGFVFVFGFPFLILFLLATVVGIPLAILLGLLYLIVFVISSVLVSVSVGYLVSQLLKVEFPRLVNFILGSIIVTALAAVPVAGSLFLLLANLYGVGLFWSSFRPTKSQPDLVV